MPYSLALALPRRTKSRVWAARTVHKKQHVSCTSQGGSEVVPGAKPFTTRHNANVALRFHVRALCLIAARTVFDEHRTPSNPPRKIIRSRGAQFSKPNPSNQHIYKITSGGRSSASASAGTHARRTVLLTSGGGSSNGDARVQLLHILVLAAVVEQA